VVICASGLDKSLNLSTHATEINHNRSLWFGAPVRSILVATWTGRTSERRGDQTDRSVVMRSPCAGAALDPPLLIVPKRAPSRSLSLKTAALGPPSRVRIVPNKALSLSLSLSRLLLLPLLLGEGSLFEVVGRQRSKQGRVTEKGRRTRKGSGQQTVWGAPRSKKTPPGSHLKSAQKGRAG